MDTQYYTLQGHMDPNFSYTDPDFSYAEPGLDDTVMKNEYPDFFSIFLMIRY